MFNRCFNTTQHISNITKNDFESNIPIKPSDVFLVEAKIRVVFCFFLHIAGISRSHGS